MNAENRTSISHRIGLEAINTNATDSLATAIKDLKQSSKEKPSNLSSIFNFINEKDRKKKSSMVEAVELCRSRLKK